MLNKINLKVFLRFWLLSNAEVPLQHCSVTKTCVQKFSFWEDTTVNFKWHLGDF